MTLPEENSPLQCTETKSEVFSEPDDIESRHHWDINDNNLPMIEDPDDWQDWPNGHCRFVYVGDLEDARRHSSGWAMRNTNNHNVNILKKSCLGVLVCTLSCKPDNSDGVFLRPAICDKARKKQYDVNQAEESSGIGCCGVVLKIISLIVIIATFPIAICLCVKIVQEYERAIIFRLGRALPGARGPGLFFIIPCMDNFVKMDLRTVSFDVPPQEILTKDSVTVAVDAVVYYRINNPFVSVVNVENASHSTRLLAQTTLRNILGTKTLSEILSERENISNMMQSVLDEGTDPWGVKVERVEIKDVRLPVQLQRAMAAEAEATREARAKVIAAEGEHKASRSLKEAADVINESPSALQLRYLQTLSAISAEKNSTIIFPLPIDLIGGLMDKWK